MSASFSLGVITLVFSILERRSPGDSSGWDPRRLPPIPAAMHAGEPEPMSRYHAVAGIVLSTLFAVAWVYLAQPQTAANFQGVRIALAPVWRSLF